MTTIVSLYISLLPVILTGVLTMIWCKTDLLPALAIPIDGGLCLSDGKRLFGKNKTWKGFLGYLVLGMFSAVGWGMICGKFQLEPYNYFYFKHSNTLWFNLQIGFWLGLAYATFELPNSFIKRRFAIKEGKNTKGSKWLFFLLLDQTDSLFGCGLVLWYFYPLGWTGYLAVILLGALTHLGVNEGLYQLKLRENRH